MVPRPPDRKVDPAGRLYHTGVRTPSPPQPNPVPHASPHLVFYSLLPPLKPRFKLLTLPLLYISCPSLSANSCWCHSDVAYTSPCLFVVLSSFVYAAGVTYPSYSNSTHLSVTSLYTLPAMLTNLKFRFILVLIPTE